ncbi:TIGR04066 family peptide maturation system protein [Ruminiclostridium herbifermentans]|uniref:TIGR04066 family peptide maturation system protein n=1 Tax=Ruminiclostridium herbifermentans TaxID=2488810 RepID=A0A4U7JJ78_9FIRM|nr:TIGR04066 family peptide maturation system protein [Ruminiclostridium herbifermentans]QNU67323.1 TIGR04066 family peptide maturation system protein [Ruminiclostridium herbifermentans]
MNSKEKLLIYPFDIQSSPIVRHINLMGQYELTALASPNGWGFSSKDAGYVDGGEDIGLNVNSNFNELIDSVDTVLFMESYNKLDIKKLVYSKIQVAADKGKNIICTLNLEDEFFNEINEKCMSKGKYLKYFSPFKGLNKSSDMSNLDSLLEITVPVVFVLGAAERTQKFEIQLSLRENLIEAGYKVSQVGSRHYCEMLGIHSFPDFMYSTCLSETKKIILFNNYIKKIELDEQPDIIVIGIPGGLMPFNKEFNNNFGIFAYEISQAILPDIAIFSTLYGDYLPVYFEKISLSIRYKLGFETDFFNLSNNIFDFNGSKMLKSMQYLTVESELVDLKKQNFKNNNIPVTNILNREDAKTLSANVIRKLTGNADIVPAI